MLSEKITVVAIFAGVLAAVFSSAVDIFFEIAIAKKSALNFRQIMHRCLLQGGILG